MAEFEAKSGLDMKNMDAARLCELVAKLCAEITAEVGSSGYRGGIYPENINIDDNGKLSIGSAKNQDWSEEELEFIAPELYWHGQTASTADVYSLGMLLYYAVSGGKLPFDGAGDAQLRRMGGENFSAPENAGRRLSEIIGKATRFNASERYQSVDELRLMLESCEKNLYIDSEKGASAIFNKGKEELSDIERMMIGIIEGKNKLAAEPAGEEEPTEEIVEEIPVEEAPVEEAAEEEIPAEDSTEPEDEDKLPEDLMALFTAEDESPAEEEIPGEETTEEVPEAEEEEAPAEEPAAEEPAAEEPPVDELPAEEEQPEEAEHEPIPILTVEENPELEPVVVRTPIIPAVQYSKSIERERKIAEEVKKRRRRPMMFILICCALLIVTAIIANAVMNDIKEKNKPAPTPPPVIATPTPAPTPKVTTYQIIVEDISWTQARDKCLEMGGHLVVIGDMAEYDQIVKLANEQSVPRLWIGCHRENGNLIWETGEEVSYYPWAKGEPSGTDQVDGAVEDYIMLIEEGGWFLDDSRNDPVSVYPQWYGGTIGYICEFEG